MQVVVLWEVLDNSNQEKCSYFCGNIFTIWEVKPNNFFFGAAESCLFSSHVSGMSFCGYNLLLFVPPGIWAKNCSRFSHLGITCSNAF